MKPATFGSLSQRELPWLKAVYSTKEAFLFGADFVNVTVAKFG